MKLKGIKKNNDFRPTFFAFPYLAICIIFVVFPLMLVLFYAFLGPSGVNGFFDANGKFSFELFFNSFTFDNFVTVFTSENLILLLKTIGIALLTTVICLLISYPTALILASKPFNKYLILALLFIIPMWMNFVLRVIALKSLLYMIGIEDGFTATMIGMVYDFLPFMLLPIYTVLMDMDKSYKEASTDLGANNMTTFFKVTLPLSLKGIVSGITMVFMPVFSAYAITGMLGDTNTNVFGGKIDGLFVTPSTWGKGSALSFVLLILVFATMLLGNLFSKRTAGAKAAAQGGAK
ncbi:MAG: ABC transporter permease [Clostridiales bacterium]|nr:ABC transporter permease [Clostridiales bacterium]